MQNNKNNFLCQVKGPRVEELYADYGKLNTIIRKKVTMIWVIFFIDIISDFDMFHESVRVGYLYMVERIMIDWISIM